MSPGGALSLVLKGGTIFDGTGAPARKGDLIIEGGTIAGISEPGRTAGAEVLDVTGLALSPGFIDTHGHSEFTLLADPRAEGKIAQGITTEINGNCGLSGGPMLGAAQRRREADLRQYGIKTGWGSMSAYLELLAAAGPALNVATLAGHGSIRGSAMGYDSGASSADDMARMEELLGEAVAAGAIGLSSGLIYPPGMYSSTGELATLARAGREAARGGSFLYASHIRGEGDRLFKALAEALEIGRRAGVGVHVSHIKTAGRDNWPKALRAIEMIEEARSAGLSVTCDRYPYTASSTELDTVLPEWVHEGGLDEELKRFKDPATRAELLRALPSPEDEAFWGAIRISSVATDESRWMEGRSMLGIARAAGTTPAEAVLEVLSAESLRVGAVFHMMSEENLKRFLSLPYTMVGTDSAARSFSGPTAMGKPHPRGFGSFPRFIAGFDGPIEEAVKRATSLPAATFGLTGRGVLGEGMRADVVVFDPAVLKDMATYEEPFIRPLGIRHVIVNGQFALRDGELTGTRAGRVLRHGVG